MISKFLLFFVALLLFSQLALAQPGKDDKIYGVFEYFDLDEATFFSCMEEYRDHKLVQDFEKAKKDLESDAVVLAATEENSIMRDYIYNDENKPKLNEMFPNIDEARARLKDKKPQCSFFIDFLNKYSE